MIYPPRQSSFVAEDNILVGNVCLYGATIGEAYFRGRAAERFAALSASARSGAAGGSLPGQLEARWKPLVALAASTAVLVALLRRLFKS